MYKCKKCNRTIRIEEVTSERITEKTKQDGDREIYLTYFRCVSCNTSFLVQIDNKETNGILQKNVFARLDAQATTDKKLKKAYKQMIATLTNELQYKRQLLNDEYWQQYDHA